MNNENSKLLAMLKLTFKSFIKDFHIYIISFVIFPIVMTFIYGYFQKNLFSPENRLNPAKLVIVDNDKSNASRALTDFLESKEISKFVEIKKEEKDASVEVKIDKNYEISIVKLSSRAEVSNAIVMNLVKNFNENYMQQQFLNNSVNSMNLSDEAKNTLKLKLNSEIAEIYKSGAVTYEKVSAGKNLSSYEYYSISIFSFMFMLTIMSLSIDFYRKRDCGVLSRIYSTNMSKNKYLNYGIICNFFFALVFNIMYVSVFRLLKISFEGSILPLAILLICKSLLEAVGTSFVTSMFKEKKNAQIFMITLMAAAVSVGGVFNPSYKLQKNIATTIFQYVPNNIIIKSFKDYLIFNDFSSVRGSIMLYLTCGLLLYVISIIKNRFTVEV